MCAAQLVITEEALAAPNGGYSARRLMETVTGCYLSLLCAPL